MVCVRLHGNQWHGEREGVLCHLPVQVLDHVWGKDDGKLMMVGDMWNGRPGRNKLQVTLTLVRKMLQVTLTLARNTLQYIFTPNCYDYVHTK